MMSDINLQSKSNTLGTDDRFPLHRWVRCIKMLNKYGNVNSYLTTVSINVSQEKL